MQELPQTQPGWLINSGMTLKKTQLGTQTPNALADSDCVSFEFATLHRALCCTAHLSCIHCMLLSVPQVHSMKSQYYQSSQCEALCMRGCAQYVPKVTASIVA